MRLLDGGRSALSAMADSTAELSQRVRNHRMFAECDRVHIGKTGFFQTQMAGGATVRDLLIGHPYLLDAALEVPFQRDRVGASADEMYVLLLIMTPLTEVVLGRRDGQQHKQDEADGAEGASAVAEEEPPDRLEIVLERHLSPPRKHPGPSRAAEECS